MFFSLGTDLHDYSSAALSATPLYVIVTGYSLMRSVSITRLSSGLLTKMLVLTTAFLLQQISAGVASVARPAPRLLHHYPASSRSEGVILLSGVQLHHAKNALYFI